MKFVKIPLIVMTFLMIISGVSYGQIIDCDAIAESPNDTVRVLFSSAGPGEITKVPIYVTNKHGLSSFQMYLEFDSTLLKPVITAYDTTRDSLGNIKYITNFYDYLIAPRYLKTDTTLDDLTGETIIDTITYFQIVNEADYPPSDPSVYQRIKLLGLVDLSNIEINPIDSCFYPTIDSGNGIIMWIPFRIAADATINELSILDFYTEAIETRDTVFPYDVLRRDCLYSRYSNNCGDIDVRFTTLTGGVRVDTTTIVTPPVINSFSANPSTISSGGSSTLSWNVTDASLITINNGVGTFTAGVSSTTVSPTSTTTYILTASNSAGTVTASATVTIGTVTNNSPVVQNVTGSPFTINQGETIIFTVTATDADPSDIITLSATSIPANATFSQVVGSGSVTGNFSFTPDFTQSGVFAAAFRATDNRGGTSNTLTVVINVNEILKDRLFTTSAVGQKPVGGLFGNPAVYFPINLVTSQTVYGIQFDFLYDYYYFSVDSFIITGRTVDYVVYDNIGQTPGEIRVVTFGLANEPIVNIVDTTAILYAVMSIDSAAEWGNYPIIIENGYESVNPDPNFPSLDLEVSSGIIQVDRLGDPNLDQRIDVADLVSIVAHIINNFTFNPRQFDAADVIMNDTVNVYDLVGVINMIYDIPISPTPVQYFDADTAHIALDYPDLLAGGNEMLVVKSELPTDIAAVEMEINYDPEVVTLGVPKLGADANNLQIRYNDNNAGKLKVLIHFTNPFNTSQLIKEGNAILLDIPIIAKDDIISGDRKQLKISKALLSTSSASMVAVDGIDPDIPLPTNFSLSQNYPNPFNPTTRIDFSINANQMVQLDIYNILGQHVKNLIEGMMPAGTHTVEWNATNDAGQQVATGIYLYKLIVDQQTESKKMLLLK